MIGRDVWDISPLLSGLNAPRLKERIRCPVCKGDELYFKQAHAFQRSPGQFRVDINLGGSMEFLRVEEKTPMSVDKAKKVYTMLKEKADEVANTKGGYVHVRTDSGGTVAGLDYDYSKPSMGIAYFSDRQVAHAFCFLTNPFMMSPVDSILDTLMRRINARVSTEKDHWILATLTQSVYQGVPPSDIREVRDWVFESYGEDIKIVVMNVLTGHWKWDIDDKLYDNEGNQLNLRLPYPPTGEPVATPLYISRKEEKPRVPEIKDKEAKPVYKSRTIWANAVTAVVITIAKFFGVEVQPESVATIFALLNAFFRAITDRPVK